MTYPEYKEHAAKDHPWVQEEMLVWDSPYVGAVWETWHSLIETEICGIPVRFTTAVPPGMIVVTQ